MFYGKRSHLQGVKGLGSCGSACLVPKIIIQIDIPFMCVVTSTYSLIKHIKCS